MGAGLTSMGPALLAAALFACSSGCAAQSCPGVLLGPVVHVDATAWVNAGPLTVSASATVCVAALCVAADPITPVNPGDLVGGVALPADSATVRVLLTTSDGRTLDRTTTAAARQTRPFGSGCGGREEIDLTVTKAGSLVQGRPASVP